MIFPFKIIESLPWIFQRWESTHVDMSNRMCGPPCLYLCSSKYTCSCLSQAYLMNWWMVKVLLLILIVEDTHIYVDVPLQICARGWNYTYPIHIYELEHICCGDIGPPPHIWYFYFNGDDLSSCMLCIEVNYAYPYGTRCVYYKNITLIIIINRGYLN